MQITLIREGNDIINILLTETTKEIKANVTALNNNPLLTYEYTWEEVYTDKTLWDLQKFFGIQ